MEDYVHKAKSLALSLRGAGKLIDDDDFIIFILRGLGSEFHSMVSAINACDSFPTLEAGISKLKNFEMRISMSHDTSSTVVFYTNRVDSHFHFHGSQGCRGRSSTTHQPLQCSKGSRGGG